MFDIISVLATAVDIADKNLQSFADPNSLYYSAQSDLDETGFRAKFKVLLDDYRKMFDQPFSKSKDLGNMLRFLPGVVVQKPMSMQAMSNLYRIQRFLLERFIKFTVQVELPLEPSCPHYILDDDLSCFLLDRDRSQLYYCNPMLQHIAICRHFLSLLDGSNAFRVRS